MRDKVSESIKTMDMKRKEDGKVFLLTGHGGLLEGKHGVVIETEEDYPELSRNTRDFIYKGFFNNHAVLSLADVYRNYEFIEKVRPEGFESSSKAHDETVFINNLDKFVKSNIGRIHSNKLRRLDIGDGITFGGEFGNIFDLSDVVELKERSIEVVKRLAINEDMLNKLLNSNHMTNELFDLIDDQMKSIGCRHYTFERPDGGDIFRLLENTRSAELRAVGYKQKD